MYQYQFLPPPPPPYGLTKMRYIKRALIAYLLRKLFKGWIALVVPGGLIFQHIFSQDFGSFFGILSVLVDLLNIKLLLAI